MALFIEGIRQETVHRFRGSIKDLDYELANKLTDEDLRLILRIVIENISR